MWRAHSDAVNQALLMRWLLNGQMENLLKTDLFDEAVSDGLSSLLNVRSKRVFYIDTSFEVHRRAKRRHPNLQTIENRCALPTLCWMARLMESFPIRRSIISNPLMILSSACKNSIVCFDQGGQMILTLDNLANPIILLRNGLPFHLLYCMKIVPYYVGVTLGPHRLQRLLKEIGFKVLEVDTIMHCPRVFAVAIARWMERHTSPKTQR